jgi:hypothetical protein
MKARVLKATPGRLGRLILRRLFDKAHNCRRPHLSLGAKPQTPGRPS